MDQIVENVKAGYFYFHFIWLSTNFGQAERASKHSLLY
jgi:hypothetical protein